MDTQDSHNATQASSGSFSGSTQRIKELLTDDPRLVERIQRRTSQWEGKLFRVQTLEVGLPDRSQGYREILLHHGGAGVLAVRNNNMCLVRQYRVAIERMTLEIPAGKLEAGEDPAVCAARELEEETGLTAESLEFVARSVGAPGFSNEATRIFRAHGLRRGEASPDEGEFVDVVWLPVVDVLAAVNEGLIQDAKTIIAAYDAFARPE